MSEANILKKKNKANHWPMHKMPFFYYEMCTLQKVGGEGSKGRRVLWMTETSLKQLI